MKRQTLKDALRAMEEAHAKWMDTSRFAPTAEQVEREKDEAINRYMRIRNALKKQLAM